VVIGDLALTDGAKEVIKAAEQGGEAKVLFQKTDVTVWKELEAVFKYTESELGVADIVCPSAGMYLDDVGHVCSGKPFVTSNESQEYSNRSGPISGKTRKTKVTRLFRLIANIPQKQLV
jgi:NAD(P)-dependent dehydrogenase (short-subunit alcohol dehydrogenase family)